MNSGAAVSASIGVQDWTARGLNPRLSEGGLAQPATTCQGSSQPLMVGVPRVFWKSPVPFLPYDAPLVCRSTRKTDMMRWEGRNQQ
jgi:hypothetical protein